MSRVIKISVLILIYLLSTAKSCDNGERLNAAGETARAAAARDSITSAFTLDALDSHSLKAFEETAILKVRDLPDYLKILSDTHTGDVIKDKVVAMIDACLVSREVLLDLVTPACPAADKELVGVLKSHGFTNAKVPAGICFDSLRMLNPLRQINDSLCTGQIGFIICCASDSAVKGNSLHMEYKAFDILAVKRVKLFGPDSIKVWTVLLGDVH